MTAIWRNDGSGWKLLSPSAFPKEAVLHRLVEEAPQLLPLAGSPRLVVLGSEVQLGPGKADLLAVETSGRPAVIEVKLAQNAESRRAVVAQVLSYAAHLQGSTLAELETTVLADHLARRGHSTIAGWVQANDQQGGFNGTQFQDALDRHLAAGSFRLVLVLDEAPAELVRLVGYLQSVSEKLQIDLITVSAFEVGGEQVIVPQLVEPEHVPGRVTPGPSGKPPDPGQLTSGVQEFVTSIAAAPAHAQEQLRKMLDWAVRLEAEGLVRLQTYRSPTKAVTLLPRLPAEGVGLVTIWNDLRTTSPAYLSVFRSVFDRRAPNSANRVEQIIAPAPLGQGTLVKNVTDELLAAVTEAYREAQQSTILTLSG